MSFFRCCVGADSRLPADATRPVGANAGRTQAKSKKPTEVFFDAPKPDGQLSSITDPPNSGRDYVDHKKKRDYKDKGTLDSLIFACTTPAVVLSVLSPWLVDEGRRPPLTHALSL